MRCEAFGSEPLGVMMDACDINTNLINFLRDEKKLKNMMWLGENTCYIHPKSKIPGKNNLFFGFTSLIFSKSREILGQ